MIPVEQTYIAYLRYIESQKNREGKFHHPSSAGRCIKIHQYHWNGADSQPMDAKGMKITRLGTIVGDDIESAMEWYWNTPNAKDFADVPINPVGKLLTQYKIELPELHVKGTLDIAIIHDAKLWITDLKTAASYKWKMMFGRNKEPDNGIYQKQVATYAMGVMLQNPEIKEARMMLDYYKKDDSTMRQITINNEVIDETVEYWNMVNQNLEEELRAGVDLGVPMQSWECNYCNYSHICPSPFKKGKK